MWRKKKICPFFLLENSRPLSPWGPLDFLSTYLGIDFLTFKEYSGLISSRIDWVNLAIQGTLKNLLQHHSSKASILSHSVFFSPTLTSIHDRDKGLEFSRRRKRQTFFFSTFLSLSPELMIIQQTTQFKLCTKDYITTMYPAWVQFLLPKNLLTNPVILKCKLWEWVSVKSFQPWDILLIYCNN